MELMEYDDGGKWERERQRGFFSRRLISSLAWAIFVLQVISNIAMFAAFLSPGWAWTRELGSEIFDGEMISYYGLYWICSRSISTRRRQICLFMSDLKDIPAWWVICQILAGLAVVLGCITMAIITLYIFRRKLNRKISLPAAIIGTALAAGLVAGALFVLFVVKFRQFGDDCCPASGHEMIKYYFSYSFYLCALSCLLHLISACLAIAEVNWLRK